MEVFYKIKTEYFAFRTKLENEIIGPPNLNSSEDCYLIEESYVKEIRNNNIYPNLSNSYQNINNLKQISIVINDFEDLIRHINLNIQLKLVNKKIFELMTFKNNLKKTNIVKYYCGNKKLIIEFKINGANKAILLTNYSNIIQSKNNIFIIKQSKDIYKNILINANYLNNKEIISFYNYIEKGSLINSQKNISKFKNSNNNIYNINFTNGQDNNSIDNKNIKEIKENDEIFKKKLINVFINIFYYEKLCSEKKANIFNRKEYYYIINPDWLDDYKRFYNYEQLENLLKKENKPINYFNSGKFLKNSNILNFGKKDFSQELNTCISYIVTSNYKIIHLLKGLIIPSKIMNIIKNIHNISIKPNEVFFNNNNIFFIKNNKIIVGNYNDIPKINAKFVFNYKSDSFDSEKKEIMIHQINEYIRLRKCNENIQDLQILRNENDEEIGKFFIINHKKTNFINNSKLFKENTKKRIPIVYKKKVNLVILRGKKGKVKYSSPKIKNKQINMNFPNSSYQQINNNIHNISNSDNEHNIKSYRNLNDKNIEYNLINREQINDNISKDLKNKNIEIIKLKEEILKIKNDYRKLENINLENKKELSKAINMINNYKKKEEEYKKTNELMNEISKKENEINKKMNYLEDKEKLLEKENIDIENKKKEFMKDIENNRRIKQENNELNKKKKKLENQIQEKEKELNNLNNKIVQRQKDMNQNNQNMNYINNSENDMSPSESIGVNTLIKNIENNLKNNQMNNHLGINNNIVEMSNNNAEIINNFGVNNNIGMSINNEKINNKNSMYNNNKEMNKNLGMNKNIGLNNNNIGINNNLEKNNNISMNNNKNIGMNNISNGNQNIMDNVIQLNPKRNISKKKEKEQKIKNVHFSINSYSKPPLIGLNNRGSKHLINAIIQCLSQSESLTNYFLSQRNKKAIFNNNIAKQNNNELQLCPAYYELIQNLWSKSGIKTYSSKTFIDLIDKMSKDKLLKYNNEEAGDAKEFIIFILKQFHKELQKSVNSENNPINNKPFNQYDKDNAFNQLNLEFQESVSIISDIFFGVNETNTICLNCKNIYNSHGLTNPVFYNYEIFNLLIFPLEEVKKMKNQKMKFYNINMIQNNIINIYECFAYNEKEELLTGDNKNYCNLCKQLSEAKYKTKIYISPNILILILNRGKGNIFNVKLIFNEYIDITQFVLKKDMPKITYSLYGIVAQIGNSGPSPHFVAECKSPVDNKWYRYNDDIVTPIKNFQKEVIDYGTPYVLFYKKNINNIPKVENK